MNILVFTCVESTINKISIRIRISVAFAATLIDGWICR